MTTARVLCVDDSPDILELMVRLLAREPGMCCVGGMERAEGLRQAVDDRGADLVLLDLNMPGVDPLEALRELRTSGAPCRVVVMSGRDDPETIDAAMKAGAAAFVSKDAGPAEIVRALRDVASAAGEGR